jgi:phospholipase C
MENKDYGAVLGSSAAPFENALSGRCGVAVNYHGVAHPSLPNYLAATGGSTFGVADDAAPALHPVAGPSLFGQVEAAGLTWRSYEESMPSPCLLANSGMYAVRHNPAAYFTDLRAACQHSDVGLEALPRDIAAGALPAFALITPNLCHDTHNCSVAAGDAWLRTWLTALLDGPNYRSGDTLVVLTWDEAEGGGSTVPAIVVAPSVSPGTVAQGRFDHYSLLRTTEDLLRLAPLGQAASASSMASAFGL